MSVKIGLVGKPSVGKSSVFRALTLAEVEIAEYPFTTIKPNVGVAYAKLECVCREFNVKCNPRQGFCLKGWRFVPVQLVDVAGLVPGAHEGKGLGNQFLDDLRNADVLIHVVDASGSTNEKGEKVPLGSYDPCRDVEFLEEELVMWIYGILKRSWGKMARAEMQRDKEDILYEMLSGLKMREEAIKNALTSCGLEDKKLYNWSDDEIKSFARTILHESKPIIIAANKVDMAPQELVDRLREKFPDKIVVPCSAHAEIALKMAAKKGYIDYVPGEKDFVVKKELNDQQRKGLEFIKEKVLDVYGSTGIQQLIDKAVFELLEMIAVFPVPNAKLTDKEGNVLPDCFLMEKGSTALDLAYAVHKELGDNFIKAIDIRTGKVVSREHELKHRDVIEIVARS